MFKARIQRIGADTAGVSLLEFALLFPVFITILMAGLDLGLGYYAKVVLTSEMTRAGRSSGLDMNSGEASQGDVDARVRNAVQQIAGNATVTFTRKAYHNYQLAESKAETLFDLNGNNKCDALETYLDANNNGSWDTDSGIGGQGGGKDVVIYSATATYARLFPMMALLGWGDTVTLQATTVLRNQPYADQAEPTVRSC